jgi:hypothetical protein
MGTFVFLWAVLLIVGLVGLMLWLLFLKSRLTFGTLRASRELKA